MERIRSKSSEAARRVMEDLDSAMRAWEKEEDARSRRVAEKCTEWLFQPEDETETPIAKRMREREEAREAAWINVHGTLHGFYGE